MRLHVWLAILCFTAPFSVGADSLEFSTTIYMSVTLEQEFPREANLSESDNLIFSSQGSCNTNLFYAETTQVDTQPLRASLCDLTSQQAMSSMADAAGPITITIAPY